MQAGVEHTEWAHQEVNWPWDYMSSHSTCRWTIRTVQIFCKDKWAVFSSLGLFWRLLLILESGRKYSERETEAE